MAEEEKYLITGNYEGTEIREESEAYSPKQAKFKAGLRLGYGGSKMSDFLKSNKVRVVRR